MSDTQTLIGNVGTSGGCPVSAIFILFFLLGRLLVYESPSPGAATLSGSIFFLLT